MYAQNTTTTTTNITEVQLSPDSDFHFEILRDISDSIYSSGGDVGEILTAAAQIQPGNFTSYYEAFNTLANAVLTHAKTINIHHFPVSAKDAYFKASTYFRSADFFLHGNPSDPRIYSLWDQQTAAFNTSLKLLPVPGKRVNIQADGFYIPAIWYPASTDSAQKPTIIIGGGYDGGQEELWHQTGYSAHERGWNVLTYEGPGGAEPRRYQNIGFIPNWEVVVTPIVDYLLTLEVVDPDAIGLVGLSFGGYLAPRASAFEKRLKATIALDGLYEFGPLFLKAFPPALTDFYYAGNASGFDEAVKTYYDKQEAHNNGTQFRWFIDQGCWSMNTTSPFTWMSELQAYTLVNVTDLIPGPIFVADSATDTFFLGQGKILADKLGDKATYYNFGASTGVGHAGIGGVVMQNQVAFDWFQEVLEGCI